MQLSPFSRDKSRFSRDGRLVTSLHTARKVAVNFGWFPGVTLPVFPF